MNIKNNIFKLNRSFLQSLIATSFIMHSAFYTTQTFASTIETYEGKLNCQVDDRTNNHEDNPRYNDGYIVAYNDNTNIHCPFTVNNRNHRSVLVNLKNRSSSVYDRSFCRVTYRGRHGAYLGSSYGFARLTGETYISMVKPEHISSFSFATLFCRINYGDLFNSYSIYE